MTDKENSQDADCNVSISHSNYIVINRQGQISVGGQICITKQIGQNMTLIIVVGEHGLEGKKNAIKLVIYGIASL